MIIRSWRGRAAPDRAHVYAHHFLDDVLPTLETIPGFLGATLMRRVDAGEIEFVVQTRWESMQAIEQFAGTTTDVAVVDPAAQAALVSYDHIVLHYEVLSS